MCLRRTRSRPGQRFPLSEERKQRLDSLGFTWRLLEAVKPIPWDGMLESLKEYKEKHGNCKVGKDKEDSRLRNWVASQKSFYAKKNLPPDRIAKLEALGFEWGRTYKKTKRSLDPAEDTAPSAAKQRKVSDTPAKTEEPALPEVSNAPADTQEPSVPDAELPPPLAAATLEEPSEPQEATEEEAATMAFV